MAERRVRQPPWAPGGNAYLIWEVEEPAIFVGGRSAGDYQVGDDVTVRFRPNAEPDDGQHALITETWYAEDYLEMNRPVGVEPEEGEEPNFGVMCRIEFLVCRDPEDPGGTEIWSDYIYDDQADVMIYRSEEDVL